jgi:hypothetical protein
MLPSINTQQRGVFSNNWVLIGICADLNLTSFVVLDEPRPSTALDTCQCRIELSLEGREIAVAGFDSGLSCSKLAVVQCIKTWKVGCERGN